MRRLLALSCSLFVFGAAAHAQAKPRPGEDGRPAETEAAYQAGVDRYAQGELAEALALFDDASRLDPENRAAKRAAARVRDEIAMSGRAARPAAPQPAARGGDESDDSAVSRLLTWVRFETTLGDEDDREGRLLAMQGKIAQLLIERRVSRSLGRAFTKDAELHALSRRLS